MVLEVTGIMKIMSSPAYSGATPTPTTPTPPAIDEPSTGQEPVIDEPGRLVPAVDPRRPGTPREIREPSETPDGDPAPESGSE